MAATQQISDEELFMMVSDSLDRGVSRRELVQSLKQIDPTLTDASADQVLREVMSAKREMEALTHPGLVQMVLALGGSLAAVAAGSWAWAWIVNLTGFEIGYMAWGIGILSALGAIMTSGGARGLAIQLICVLTSTAGILGAKYLLYQDAIQVMLKNLYGAETTLKLNLFSAHTQEAFKKVLSQNWDFFDFIWLGFAIYTAFAMTSAHPPKAD